MTKLSFFSLITNMGEINDSNKKKKRRNQSLAIYIFPLTKY